MIKTLNKLGMEGNFFSLIKEHIQNPIETPNLRVKDWTLSS